MSRRVVLISDSPDRLHALQVMVPDDVEVVRREDFSFQFGPNDPLLVIADLAAPHVSLTNVTDRLKEYPVIAWVAEDQPISELNHLLPTTQVMGLLTSPLDPTADCDVVIRALDAVEHRRGTGHLRADLAHANQLLNRRLQALNTLYTVGKFIVSTLDHDEVLRRIMDVALNTTQAEEGFILLRERDNLFLRAAKNVQDDLVERFHKKAADEVAWRVIRSGRPVMLHRETKIATGYLARALLYVPLTAPGEGPFGVIAVINRTRDDSFDEEELFTLSSVADFAAIMLRNAKLFETVEVERSRLRALMERATEVILIADEQGRLLLWSESARTLFDIPDEARGQPVQGVITQPDLLDLIQEAAQNRESLHTELSLDGDRVFNTQLTYVSGLGGVVIMQDITHLKELDRLKSEFVSMVSHDLRTPLTTIQGYVALLEKAGPLNEMQAQFVEKALDSLTYITDLISDLLDIGRIEAGYDLDMAPLCFDLLIEEICDEMAPQAGEADITLRCSFEDTPLWVNGSMSRLRQVVENLISNAIKYNRPGGWVNVSARNNNGCMIVSVSDNGLGISNEDQAKVFDRFYRVERPETSDIQGTGLGLAIVKSVVARHKGRVWVESELGKGSIFSFVLPLISSDET